MRKTSKPSKTKKRDRSGREVPEVASLDIPARRFWDTVDHEKVELFMTEPQYEDKYQDFLRSFHDPNQMSLTFPARLRRYNITLHEVQQLYSNGMQQLALLQMSNNLPQIAADVSNNAKNQTVLCSRCDGLKYVLVVERDDKGEVKKKVQRDCPVCKATGEVTVPGDKQALDLVFESMKLTKQSGGPLVNINQMIGQNAGMDSNVEGLLKMTQSITVGDRK